MSRATEFAERPGAVRSSAGLLRTQLSSPSPTKFGVELSEAEELLQATRQVADALGICFHVGSQAMAPHAYTQAIERVRAAIVDASVTVDIVDVGGGFPSTYPGMEPPPLEAISTPSTARSRACRSAIRPNFGASRAVR